MSHTAVWHCIWGEEWVKERLQNKTLRQLNVFVQANSRKSAGRRWYGAVTLKLEIRPRRPRTSLAPSVMTRFGRGRHLMVSCISLGGLTLVLTKYLVDGWWGGGGGIHVGGGAN